MYEMEKNNNVQVGRLIVKLHASNYLLFGGHYVKKPIISPTLLLPFFNMHTYI
jgi:hypothetical protein